MTGAPLERHAAIETAWVVDRHLLFDERDGVVHELSPSASAVWGLIDGVRSEGEIVRSLTRAFGQDLSEDVRQVLDDFRGLGLLSDGGGERG